VITLGKLKTYILFPSSFLFDEQGFLLGTSISICPKSCKKKETSEYALIHLSLVPMSRTIPEKGGIFNLLEIKPHFQYQYQEKRQGP
jgi:hypothetical protein